MDIELKRVIMDKPLFSKRCHALEYKHLFKSHDDMNFYSAKEKIIDVVGFNSSIGYVYAAVRK